MLSLSLSLYVSIAISLSRYNAALAKALNESKVTMAAVDQALHRLTRESCHDGHTRSNYLRSHPYAHLTYFCIMLFCSSSQKVSPPSRPPSRPPSHHHHHSLLYRTTGMQMKLGLFDDKTTQPYFHYGIDKIDSPEHQQVRFARVPFARPRSARQ